MKPFYIDGGKVYSYSLLVEEIDKETGYCPLYKTSDTYAYWKNLLKALAGGQPVTLLDSDMSPDEIAGIDIARLNVSVGIEHEPVRTVERLIAAVKDSKSEIAIFTSGTTGQPKKIVHTVASLTRTTRIGEKYRNDVWGFAYNPTHMAGLQVFFQAFENRNTMVNLFGKGRTEIYDMIRWHQITHLSATPTFYRLLLPVEESCPGVIRATVGGERSDEKLYDDIKKIFPNARVNNIYASTEAGTLFSSQDDCFRIPEAIRDRIKVAEQELLIHKSLLGTSDDMPLHEDYYHSGDIVEWVNEDKGVFRFVSRKNGMINAGGYKVNPEEVEAALMSVAGIRQALVYGRSNSVLGNVVCADVVPEPGSRIDAIEIRQAMQGRLQDFKIPRRIRIVEALPLTRTGKLKRS
jgi:acyl-coenzyme A synthetase/AMP-(fatty) acid ligase